MLAGSAAGRGSASACAGRRARPVGSPPIVTAGAHHASPTAGGARRNGSEAVRVIRAQAIRQRLPDCRSAIASGWRTRRAFSCSCSGRLLRARFYVPPASRAVTCHATSRGDRRLGTAEWLRPPACSSRSGIPERTSNAARACTRARPDWYCSTHACATVFLWRSAGRRGVVAMKSLNSQPRDETPSRLPAPRS